MVDSPLPAGFGRYRMSGLTVASEVALPGAIPLARAGTEDGFVREEDQGEPGRDDTAPPDVVLRLGEVPDVAEEAVLSRGANWFVAADRFVLDLPGIGRFMAEGGRTITVRPAAGVPIEDVLVFATGTTLAAILYQRGAMLLHGASVFHGGRAFVLCGPSGAGKSTLAAALCRAGCDFAGDDVCAVTPDVDGRPAIHPDGRRLRLFADSIRLTGLEDAVGPRVRAQVAKFHVTPPNAQAAETGRAVSLGAVYVLVRSDATQPPGLVALSPVTAAQALLRQAYRRPLALAYAGRGQIAARTAGLLGHCSVHRLSRPRDLDRLDETVALLRDHWDRLPGPGR